MIPGAGKEQGPGKGRDACADAHDSPDAAERPPCALVGRRDGR
jgi:hypothetical protein